MKNMLSVLINVLIVSGACFLTNVAAQPTDAQLKKQLTAARTVSVTLGKPGTIAWSSTYKKYVWSRNFTGKLKTDQPGVFLLVKATHLTT